MLTEAQKEGLGVALEEATLLGAEVNTATCVALATFRLLTLPAEGPEADDSRVQFRFERVRRVVASLRHGRWDDPAAAVEPFAITDLLRVVQSFHGLPVYGWSFFDVPAADYATCLARPSCEWSCGTEPAQHMVRLFQAGPRHLDLCIWFDELRLRDPQGRELTIEEVAAGGQRWWNAFAALDPRTQGRGMQPLD